MKGGCVQDGKREVIFPLTNHEDKSISLVIVSVDSQ